MDYVYIVRPGERNEELRYSLRSVQRNLPLGRIWIAGHKPAWLRNVHHVATVQDADKHTNAERNLRAAVEHPGIRSPFVLLNDDMFVMRRMAAIPTLYRGPLAFVLEVHRRLRAGSYYRAMLATAQLIEALELPDPKSYELHTPMVIDKRRMAQTLAMGAHIPRFHLRTLYGNLARVGGELSGDVKVYSVRDREYQSWPFLSTTDTGFHRLPAGEWIRSQFPEPSRYESM